MNEREPRGLSILLDQGMPAAAAQMLRDIGYQCTHVSEIGMQSSEDEEILLFAREHGWTVVTLDADFHALLAVRGWTRPSVVRLRREGCRAMAAVGILTPVLDRYSMAIAEGVMISVKEHKVTCHRLPVGGEK